MPEGDSIYKDALHLRPLLLDHPLHRCWMRDRGWVERLKGKRVQAVDAYGKHLLIAIEPEWVIRVHLGMYGRWRTFEGARAAKAPFTRAAVGLETAAVALLCFRAMQAELVRAGDPVLRRRLQRLGPDLLGPQPPWDEILHRARTGEPRSIAELLLDQQVAAGIGNVYKSEVLFLEGVHPLCSVDALEDATLLHIYRQSRTLMLANLGPGARTTTLLASPGVRRPPSTSRTWVYRRSGLPCFRCGSPIARTTHGDMARSTYWCPRCQPPASAPVSGLRARTEH